MEIETYNLPLTETFKKHIASLEDPESFLENVRSSKNLVEWLRVLLPKEIGIEDFASSLLLNWQQDYNSIVTDLPLGFSSQEDEYGVHEGNINQIGIYYHGQITNDTEEKVSRIACLNFHFRDIEGDKLMCLDNVQGELKDSELSKKAVRRIYGKLNYYFEEDWRCGLLRQPLVYARERNMKVKGKIPGFFYIVGAPNIETYPIYALNHLRTYLNLGIPLDDIEFEFIDMPKNLYTIWDTAFQFLKDKSLEEKIDLIASAYRDYTTSYEELLKSWEASGYVIPSPIPRKFYEVMNTYFS